MFSKRRFENGSLSALRPEDQGGLKDTVFVGPYESVSILISFKNTHIGRFDFLAPCVWSFEEILCRFPFHCHSFNHEDYAMMRQFLVVNAKERCNRNGRCECGEDCVSCPSDCLLQSGERCGDGVCEVMV